MPDSPAADPIVLGFDTSAAHCAAAVVSGGRVLATRTEPMTRGQAERLFPLLEQVLADAGVDWHRLSAIGVGVGPGNFTGVRISVAAARGLALSLGIAAHGVSVTEAAAYGTPRPCRAVVPLRGDEVVWQDFGLEGGAGGAAPMTAADRSDAQGRAGVQTAGGLAAPARAIDTATGFASPAGIAGPDSYGGVADRDRAGTDAAASFSHSAPAGADAARCGVLPAGAPLPAAVAEGPAARDRGSRTADAEMDAGDCPAGGPLTGSEPDVVGAGLRSPRSAPAGGPSLARSGDLPVGPTPLSPVWPLAEAIALVAQDRLARGVAPDRPAPLYLRPADAAPPRDPAPVILP